MSDTWEITALRYGRREPRSRADSFIFDDDHAAPHPLDYYVWLLESDGRRILVDTGYDDAEGEARARPVIEAPARMLAARGVEPSSVETVILTHLHYDHAGSLKAFPNAQLWVQEREMAYATGPCMCHETLRQPFTGEHVCDMVRALFAGRVRFVAGSAEVAPGLEVHLVGGHTRGLQVVRVRTRRGWVVLASDATHFYENFLSGKPFPIVVDVEDMLAGFATLLRLADSVDHVVPGHDPMVRAAYPQLGSENVVALHAAPRTGIWDSRGRAIR